MKKDNSGDEKLMSTVDSGEAEDNNGKIAEESINNSMGSFTPDLLFQNMVRNYKNAKKLYGETIIRELTDFEPGFVEKNIKIPEFQKEIKKNIAANVKKLQSDGIVDNEFVLTDSGIELAAVHICQTELDKLKIKGVGDQKIKEKDINGSKEEYALFRRGSKYKDVSITQTIKSAVRRAHNNISIDDMRIYERKKQGKLDIIYAIDASGSMKGKRIGMSKRAGIALAYKAILDKNRVGIIVFDTEIRKTIELTINFNQILKELVIIKAKNKTNIHEVIKTATRMLSKSKNTKHIVILSDAMPNVGEKPKIEIFENTATAFAQGITTSVIGINLEKEGQKIAEKIANIGNGRLYGIKKTDELDAIILEDYEFAKRN